MVSKYTPLRANFLIEKGNEWHIITYDLAEELYAPPEENHFDHEHIHYISYLMGRNIDKNQIWNNLCEHGQLKGPDIHIRVANNERKRSSATPVLSWLDLPIQ